MNDSPLIPQATAETLAKSGAIREGVAIHSRGSWMLTFRVGVADHTLRSTRLATPRLFKTLDALVRLCHALGVPRVLVDVASWSPATSTTRRR